MTQKPSERTIVLVIAAVQFVNILDFMIVMPLGPDFARALDIPVSQLGYVGGSYTAAACVSGLAGAFFLDRFDRRSALAVALAGLVVGTLAGAFARGLASLVAARVVAGAFGGPATSLAYSIVGDVIPQERRGKAVGTMMSAFSIATILGVPAGLELARIGTWRLPFIAVALLGAVIGTTMHILLPPMFGHVARARENTLRDLLGLLRRDVGIALALSALAMAAVFVITPNISTYLINNLRYPRERLGLLYLVGGAMSLGTMRIAGPLVDRFGSTRVGGVGVCFVALVMYLGFVVIPPPVPIMVVFCGFMVGMALRNVSYSTVMSKVPRAAERARFSSMQSAVQHAASALAAFCAAEMLAETPEKALVGMPAVAYVSIALGVFVVPLMWTVERGVLQKTSERS